MKQLIFLSIFTLAVATHSHAQDRSFGGTVFIGFPLGVFDIPASGIHFSINPLYRVSGFFSLEGQVSYSNMKYNRSDDFFGHDGGSTQNLNLLVGGRVYVTKESRKIRPFIHLLLGYGRGHDKYYDASNIFRTEETGPLGITMGLNLEVFHSFSIGLGVEGPTPNIVAKMGYKF
jgi:hypothetical protein